MQRTQWQVKVFYRKMIILVIFRLIFERTKTKIYNFLCSERSIFLSSVLITKVIFYLKVEQRKVLRLPNKVQSDLCVHRFCICVFNQSGIESIWKGKVTLLLTCTTVLSLQWLCLYWTFIFFLLWFSKQCSITSISISFTL